MPSTPDDSESFHALCDIFDFERKRDLEKHCAAMVVTGRALSQLIHAGSIGLLTPLLYASHFGEHIPDDVELLERDFRAIGAAQVGPIEGPVRKAFNKIEQSFLVQRRYSAHLFYFLDGSRWYLFYFDQRDRSSHDNHWKEGSHIHLVTNLSNLDLERVWQKVQTGDFSFGGKIHLRYAE